MAQMPSAERPLSCVIACTRGKLLTMLSLIRQKQTGKNIGSTGNNMRPQQKSTLSSTHLYLPSNVTSSKEHFLVGSGQGGTEEEIISRYQESWMPSRPSQIPLSWMENQVSSTGLKKIPTPPRTRSRRFPTGRPSDNTTTCSACYGPHNDLYKTRTFA